MRRVRNKDERALAVHSTQGPKSPTSLNVNRGFMLFVSCQTLFLR